MAEMQQMVDEQEAQPPKPGRAELEEEEDNVADFLEVTFGLSFSNWISRSIMIFFESKVFLTKEQQQQQQQHVSRLVFSKVWTQWCLNQPCTLIGLICRLGSRTGEECM